MTAEFALALPAVALVITVTLAAFGLQIERMKMVSLAATASRALGRGEGVDQATALVTAIDAQIQLKVEYLPDFVCPTLSKSISIASLPPIEVSERQCARKAGL